MANLNTTMEIPPIDSSELDSEFVSAFGYLEVADSELHCYVLARQFRDNCEETCACDRDYYNPAFLTPTNEFLEYGNENSNTLNEVIQLFTDIEAVHDKVKEIQLNNIHINNDLLIYKIWSDKPEYYIFLKIQEIIIAKPSL